jgi:hypothetical protein
MAKMVKRFNPGFEGFLSIYLLALRGKKSSGRARLPLPFFNP